MYILALCLGIAFVGIVTMMAVQISWGRRGQHVITTAQLVTRMVYAAVVLCVLVIMFVGRYLLKWESTRAELLYWLGTLAIVIMIAIVAAGDWRHVIQMQEQRQRQMYRELVALMRRDIRRKKGEQATAKDREQ